MGLEIHADYSQQFLLPPSLEDWLAPDHPARFLRDFVSALDLDALGFHQRQSGEGRPSYSSELLLTAWLYGYMEKLRSSRKIEHACRTHLPLIWLLGMNAPDHNSLWRFWRSHRAQISSVFKQSVVVAQRLGLVGMVVHALDGTKVATQSSFRGALHRDDLQKFLLELDKAIEEIETTVASEDYEATQTSSLPEALQEAKQRREAIAAALENLEEMNLKHLMPLEPDARMMMQANGRTGWNYNAQAVVDDANGIVVAQDVTNEATDYRQLTPMLEQARENAGGVAKATVADAGYRSAQQQLLAAELGHNVIVPPHGREADDGSPYHKSRFEYDEQADQYICPEGKPLLYSHTLPPRGNRFPGRVYRCRQCKHCPVRSQCTTARYGRTIHRDGKIQNELPQHDPVMARQLIARRKTIIEPLFGHIKENEGLRRWNLRGLDNAKAQWAMLCLTQNLKKIFAQWQRTTTTRRFAALPAI